MNSLARKAVSDFFKSFPQKSYLKGATLIMPKAPLSHIFYIEKGIIRSYLISQKGNEVTINFLQKEHLFPLQ